MRTKTEGGWKGKRHGEEEEGKRRKSGRILGTASERAVRKGTNRRNGGEKRKGGHGRREKQRHWWRRERAVSLL